MNDLIYPDFADQCAACRCHWDTDLFGDPNRQLDGCPGCDCHTWEFAESRARAVAEDALEVAWKAAGYATSYAVYQAEGR